MTTPTHTSLWQDLRSTSFARAGSTPRASAPATCTSGDKSLPPLILLHGVGGHAEAYARNLDAHGRYFNTWSIDMLGHGWTDKPTTRTSCRTTSTTPALHGRARLGQGAHQRRIAGRLGRVVAGIATTPTA